MLFQVIFFCQSVQLGNCAFNKITAHRLNKFNMITNSVCNLFDKFCIRLILDQLKVSNSPTIKSTFAHYQETRGFL